MYYMRFSGHPCKLGNLAIFYPAKKILQKIYFCIVISYSNSEYLAHVRIELCDLIHDKAIFDIVV